MARADITEMESLRRDVAELRRQIGYVIQQIESARDAWKVKAMDANGMWVEAYLNPVTGAPLNDRKKK